MKSDSFLSRARPGLYVLVVVLVALGAYGRQLLADTIYACSASGYSPDRYLAYCQAKHYGDYEHGAFWFGLEPVLRESAAKAQVMFIGNSRLQWAFSNATTAKWFGAAPASYYLMGFSYYENYVFEEQLLHKLAPRARIYVINLDSYFQPVESEPAKYIFHDEEALGHYEGKRRWQSFHRLACRAVSLLCGKEYTIYRSRSTGTWFSTGGSFKAVPVSEDPAAVDPDFVRQQVESGRRFLSGLPVKSDCVIFTIIPTFNTHRAAALQVAAKLGVELISPGVDGLATFDGSHLERASAERWATQFLQAAGPRIHQCLDRAPADSVTAAPVPQ